jgi:phospholipid/cholesterol/gamma-HCH transport system ATP-binding protein
MVAILRMRHVRSSNLFGAGSTTELEFSLEPGELMLVNARDPMLAAGFADLCLGLDPTQSGVVRFLDRDWARLPREVADALRGQIGRVLYAPGWLSFLDVTSNILLSELYHTRRHAGAIRDQAAALARHFGLPGIPAGPVEALSQEDLLRAGYVRAFLGDPKLVILESPVQGLFAELVPQLLNQLATVRERGGAAIWLTRSRLVWDNRAFPATQRLHLAPRGLAPVGAAA